MSRVSISIVTYNHSIEQISKVLLSVDFKKVYKVFIVDNSPNKLLKYLEELFDVEYINTRANIGFGSAHNIAIRKAISEKVKYHLVLNPDIYFKTEIFVSLLNYMDDNPDVGLLMPKILYPNGEIQFLPKLIPHPIDLIIRRVRLLHIFFKKRLERYELKKYSKTVTFNAPILSGCFSLFRVDVFSRVGFYDEGFFMYFEDFDLSRRINKYYKTVYFSEAEIFHEYERGAQKNFKLFKIFLRSAVIYFNKWGWFIDKERNEINKLTIKQFKL